MPFDENLLYSKWNRKANGWIPGGVGPILSGSPVGDTSCDGNVRAIVVAFVRSGGCVARQYAYEHSNISLDLQVSGNGQL